MSIDNLVSFRPRRLESPPRKARTGWTIGDVRISEVVAVLRAIGSGRVWPGRGWWHPAQRRHDWNWLAARHGLGAAAIGDAIYVVAGGPTPGGSQSPANERFDAG